MSESKTDAVKEPSSLGASNESTVNEPGKEVQVADTPVVQEVSEVPKVAEVAEVEIEVQEKESAEAPTTKTEPTSELSTEENGVTDDTTAATDGQVNIDDTKEARAEDLKETSLNAESETKVTHEPSTATSAATEDSKPAEKVEEVNGNDKPKSDESKAKNSSSLGSSKQPWKSERVVGKPGTPNTHYAGLLSAHKQKERYRENNKFDPSSMEESSDPDEIRKQVEFYFSDSNLPMDQFLLKSVGGTANKPVPIKTIHNFKRMRRFQPYSAIVAALKESTILDVTDDEQVKRKVPIDKSALGKSVEEGAKWVEDKTLSRSIYAKGFGEETPTTQFEIEAFFAPYGQTNAIRLRRTFTGIFKGSVFVEFANDAIQQKFMAIEPKPKWKGNVDLFWKTKKAYVEDKAEDFASGRLPMPKKGRGDLRRSTGGNDDWRKRRDDDQKRGFRDDRDRRGGRGGHGSNNWRGHGGRDNRRGGGRGGRDDRRGGDGVERDSRGVPIVHTVTPSPPSKVKKETKKEENTSSPTNPKPATTATTDSAATSAPATAPQRSEEQTTPSKKRAREDDDASKPDEPSSKRGGAKAEVMDASSTS